MNNDYRKILDRATRQAWQLFGNPNSWHADRFQLWYRPSEGAQAGDLFLIAGNQTADGAFPVSGSTEIPWLSLTVDQIWLRLRDLSANLPILPVEDAA